MKWFALLTILANVAFFGWRYEMRLREARDAPPAAAIPAGTASLRLIAELDEFPPMREETVVAATAVPAQTFDSAISMLEQPPVSEPMTELPTATIETLPAATDSAVIFPPAVEYPAASNKRSATTPPGMPEPPAISARPVTGVGVAADFCVDIGPFSIAKDADAIEVWLASRAAALHRVVQIVRKRPYFWVYLEPRNAEEAESNVTDLARKGVRDFSLVQRGGLHNAISLGLFSTQEAVNRRLSEMSKQGFQPVVVPRIEVTDLQWLRANLAVGYTDSSAIPREPLAGVTVKEIDCAKIADLESTP